MLIPAQAVPQFLHCLLRFLGLDPPHGLGISKFLHSIFLSNDPLSEGSPLGVLGIACFETIKRA